MSNINRYRGAALLRSLGPTLQFPTSRTANCAFFHSTPSTCQKHKSKWDDYRSDQKPTKNYVRYECRQKRADGKKALKDLLDKTGFLNVPTEDWYRSRKVERFGDWEEEPEDDLDSSKKKSKYHSRSSEKFNRQRYKRKPGNPYWDAEFDDSEKFFQSIFGNKKYTWSFDSWSFDWKEGPRRHSNHNRKEWKWNSNYETRSDDATDGTYTVGSASDRILLGLAPRGPLKIEEVKNAYHEYARKWHPDMHEGASKTAAEEKFKLYANAYSSLKSALAAS